LYFICVTGANGSIAAVAFVTNFADETMTGRRGQAV
jgi:hypothetical protein